MRTKVNIPSELVSNQRYQSLLREVETYLQGIVFQPTLFPDTETAAELRLYENGSRTPVLVIEIHEGPRSTVRAFYLEELSDPAILRLRVGEMTRQLLRGTGREVQQRIRETVSQMVEGE